MAGNFKWVNGFMNLGVKMINLLHGDCLELMKSIPDKSIDMVLTDPPYGTTACKWDVVIPTEPMWKELKRITKDNGAICLFGSEPFSSHLRMSNIKMFKYDWVWNKGVGVNFLHVNKEPMKVYEIVSLFGFKTLKYYPQKQTRVKPIKKSNNVAGKSSGYRLNSGNFVGKVYADKYPETILNFSSRSKGSRGLHPTQKPVALLEYLIKTYTLENETVLDFTMGSGSTGVACKNLNRKFIGIEKDDNYFKIAMERINNHNSQGLGSSE